MKISHLLCCSFVQDLHFFFNTVLRFVSCPRTYGRLLWSRCFGIVGSRVAQPRTCLNLNRGCQVCQHPVITNRCGLSILRWTLRCLANANPTLPTWSTSWSTSWSYCSTSCDSCVTYETGQTLNLNPNLRLERQHVTVRVPT